MFEKGGQASIWTEAIASGGSEKWKIFGFSSNNLGLKEGFL